MDLMVEAIFVAFGYIINFMGGTLAILLIAFLPLYCCGFAFFQRNINWRSSRPAMLSFLAAGVLTVLLTTAFAITAVTLGAWG